MKDKIFVIGALFIYPISFIMWVLGGLLRIVLFLLWWGVIGGTLEYSADFIHDLSWFIRDLFWYYTP